MIDLGKNVQVETEKDVLGGQGGPLESGLYDFKITMAYITVASSEAMAVNLVLETEDNRTMKHQEYIRSGIAKNKKFTYTDKKTGEERPLPGYALMDTLCKLSIGKPLNELEPENKTIALYNYELQKEVPTEVPVLVELLGSEISMGVLKVIEDKKTKNGEGKYVPNGETRTVNTVSKLFKTEGRLTGSEIAAGLSEGEFAAKWADKNTGQVVDKSTGKASASAPTLGGATPAASTTPPVQSLFG